MVLEPERAIIVAFELQLQKLRRPYVFIQS